MIIAAWNGLTSSSGYETAKGNVIIPGNFDFSDTEVGEELWGYEVSPTGVCNPFGDNHTMDRLL